MEIISGSNKTENPKSKNQNQSAQAKGIRLTPEQIEEIHTDDYSLVLFYATRTQELSLSEIKRNFPEPTPQKAKSVLNRFISAGLVRKTENAKYYSNFPDGYVNYSNYRYDTDLEVFKESKIFQLMKQFTGVKEYWTNKTYFSMDAFFTDEQSEELQTMFHQLKMKAKKFAAENTDKKSVEGLKFRRIKFYDMFFSLMFAFISFFLGAQNVHANGLGSIESISLYQDVISYDAEVLMGGGGNDPTERYQDILDRLIQSPNLSQTLNENLFSREFPIRADELFVNQSIYVSPAAGYVEPILPLESLSFNPHGSQDLSCLHSDGGGGFDPKGGSIAICCVPDLDGKSIPSYSVALCKTQSLLYEFARCQFGADTCREINAALEKLILTREN